MKPSTAKVYALLKVRGVDGVSPDEARLLAGCDRLAARVCELRAEGHDIRTGSETAHGATYARYRLYERPVQLSAFDSPDSAWAWVPSRPRTVQAAERQPQRAAR